MLMSQATLKKKNRVRKVEKMQEEIKFVIV